MGGIVKGLDLKLPCFMAICLVGSLGAAPPEGVTPVKKLEFLAGEDGVLAGQTLRVALRVSLAGEFHVNSHVPSTEYLIPTTFDLVAPEGFTAQGWDFPEGKNKRFPYSDVPLSVYEGTFVIRGSLKIAEGTLPGGKQARGMLKYQACTSQRCYPPKKEEVTLEFRVVPPGTTVQPLHPEVFRPVAP
jgi:Disulphide bond corrector protein DsbC.